MVIIFLIMVHHQTAQSYLAVVTPYLSLNCRRQGTHLLSPYMDEASYILSETFLNQCISEEMDAIKLTL